MTEEHSTDSTMRQEQSTDASKKSEAGTRESSPEPAHHTDGQVEQPHYMAGARLCLIVASITLVMFLTLLDTAIIGTAVPILTEKFHSLDDVGWYGSAYLLASCTMQPLIGKIYTIFDTKATFLTFLGVFEVGSLVCGLARSSAMLIAGRVVAGLGGAGLFNGSLTILSRSAPLHRQPVLMGIVMSLSQLGTVSGPLIGGALTEYVSWRWCFFINLPIGAAAAIPILVMNLPGGPKKSTSHVEPVQSKVKHNVLAKKSRQLDITGAVLFVGLALMILFPLQWAGSKFAWKSPTIIGLFSGSGAMLCIFLAWEHRCGTDALIPLSMVRKSVVWSSCLMSWALCGGIMISSYYLPIYFQAVKDASPAKSGVYVLPSLLGQLLTNSLCGWAIGRFGYYLPWGVASGILVTVSMGLISTFKPRTSTAEWIMYQLIGGIGRGAGLQLAFTAIQNCLPMSQISTALAIVMLAQNFGGALFLSLAQTVFYNGLRTELGVFAPNVDAQEIITAGATGFRKILGSQGQEVQGVVMAYSKAFDRVYYLGIAAGIITFLFAWGMGFGKANTKHEVVEKEAAG